MERFPRSIRKYIRKEKARIRREIISLTEQNRRIADLLEKLKIQYNKTVDDKKIKSRN